MMRSTRSGHAWVAGRSTTCSTPGPKSACMAPPASMAESGEVVDWRHAGQHDPRSRAAGRYEDRVWRSVVAGA
jgi:hypothetical protein